MRGIKYMPRKRIDNRMVSRGRSVHSLRRFTIVFLLGCALVLGMIFSGWGRWKQREIVYRFNRLQSRVEVLLETRKRLIMELSRLKAPERISSIAKEELGMVEPALERIHPVREAEDSLPETARLESEAEVLAERSEGR